MRHPEWDPAARLLTVFLAKEQTAVVPLSSYMMPLAHQFEIVRRMHQGEQRGERPDRHRTGDRAGPAAAGEFYLRDATPLQEIGDTKRHIVRCTAAATSRYREYFAQDQDLDFIRTSEPVVVDVPALGRPLGSAHVGAQAPCCPCAWAAWPRACPQLKEKFA